MKGPLSSTMHKIEEEMEDVETNETKKAKKK